MSRSLFEIAYGALDDLYEVQNAFNQMNALFDLLAEKSPKDSLADATAQLGIIVMEEWSTKVAQWAERLDNELDGFPSEAKAYRDKHLRREVLRVGSAKLPT
ncbi:hypothetical protein [Pseudomonas sp. PS02290]|uniref:hypothetical protein n=1 Tax=Pseudomonas sp. PS02290 TaxID=2991430 RepID=UPI00249AD76D|nr:hypothetical protein [Pseudomonas sp. PS02290]